MGQQTPEVLSVRIPTHSGLLCGQLTLGGPPAWAPAIVLESELAGSLDATTHGHAHRLAAAGWTVLTFDHSGFGSSGGRTGTLGRIAWKQQVSDLRAAWMWLRRRTGIDGNRVGIWAHGLGAWRARLLAQTDADIRAMVLHAPCWPSRQWLLQPDQGFALLQRAGYFSGSNRQPMEQPEWLVAWAHLLKSEKPTPARLPDIPLMVWTYSQPDGPDVLQAKRARMGKSSRLEWHELSDRGSSNLVTLDAAGQDPVISATNAFLRQYL